MLVQLPLFHFDVFYKIRGRFTEPMVIFSQSHAIDTGQQMTTLRSRHIYSRAATG